MESMALRSTICDHIFHVRATREIETLKRGIQMSGHWTTYWNPHWCVVPFIFIEWQFDLELADDIVRSVPWKHLHKNETFKHGGT